MTIFLREKVSSTHCWKSVIYASVLSSAHARENSKNETRQKQMKKTSREAKYIKKWTWYEIKKS